MIYSEFITSVELRLRHLYEPVEGRAMAVRLLQDYCGISSYEHIVEPFGMIATEYIPLLERAVLELSEARPLQYILGKCEFAGKVFHVEEGVLIPRPETEELVRWIIQDYRIGNMGTSVSILDAACGSGCIGISLASAIAKSKLYMCDISEKALEISGRNCNALLGAGREPAATIFHHDLLGESTITNHIPAGSLDIIVSNPPYVRESERVGMRRNVLDYEPSLALFVPDEDPLLFYRSIAEMGTTMLTNSGRLYFEINEAYGNEVVQLLDSLGYSNVEVKEDINGRERMVRASSSLRASSSRCRVSHQGDQPHAGK